MPDRYYDVIVVGRSVGALVAAALLARRDFTVLHIGQAVRPANYSYQGLTLRRRAFSMLAATSPAWLRIARELAQSQTWRQRVEHISPMLQIVSPGRRFDVPPDAARFAREVDREFPEVKRHLAELYSDFARVTAAADRAFSHDAVWPPGTFLERRAAGRIASTLPYARAEPHADLLAEFPRDHVYRRIVTESVRFASHSATLPPAFAVARLHGSWTRGVQALKGGEEELDGLLLERIAANGGVHMMNERVAAIDVKRGAVAGALLDGENTSLGAGFIITDMMGEEVAALASGRGISKKAQREWPRITPTTRRFVVSLIAAAAGVPEALGREVLLLPRRNSPSEVPTIRLQRADGDDPSEVLFVAEVLLPERGGMPLKEMRRHVVDRMCAELPFLERHLRVVDSVHDGLPLWAYDEATAAGPAARRAVERTALSGAAIRPEAMACQLEIDPPGYLGIAGEPLRGPIDKTLLVGPSVLPALGQEGQLLAALSAARLVTKSDKRKARMRREMWTKIEIS